ncbi:MAG: ABC transporter substrate-binding protein [Alphaproteobacteria bacterium]|nr:ABC transporter substrate-binding protein [Alphaproteobacteria bacterium]
MNLVIRAAALAAAVALAAPASAQAPQRGGTLVFSITGEPETYDCHASPSIAVLQRVAPHYSTLLKVDTTTYPRVVGDAAERWTASPDGLVYTFTLRENVRFHDGSVLTSEDVRATFDRIRNPPQGVVSLRRALLGNIAAIETPDARTVVFRLSQPNAAMPIIFANPWNCLYSARKLAAGGSYPAREVMGTGPFRFVEHVAGDRWVGARFDGYFLAGRPHLDGFRAISIAGPALINALAGGQTMADFRGVAPAERDRLRAERGERIRFAEIAQTGTLMLTFNAERAPFSDPRVRRALSIAIDRWGGAEPMGRLTIFGIAGGFLRPGDAVYARSREELSRLPGFGPDMAANRAEARRLLAEANVANLTVTFTNRPQYTPIGVFLIDQWRQIGVTTRHEQPENTAFFASRSSGNFDVIADAMNEYVDDPSLYFAQFLSRDRNPSNISRSTDRTLDTLYDGQARSLDQAERVRLARAFEERLLTEAYSVPLFWARRIVPSAAEVQGFTITPSYFLGQDLAEIWLAR